MISAPDRPSITEWWIFVRTATSPDSWPSITYSSHSGRARSSGRDMIRATWSASCWSVPGDASAISRTW